MIMEYHHFEQLVPTSSNLIIYWPPLSHIVRVMGEPADTPFEIIHQPIGHWAPLVPLAPRPLYYYQEDF